MMPVSSHYGRSTSHRRALAFVLETLDRSARLRFRAEVARLVLLFVTVAAVCWAIAPAVDALLQSAAPSSS